MKFAKTIALITAMLIMLTACGYASEAPEQPEVTVISVSDTAVTVDGAPAGTDASAAVYTANDIIYYESGKDFTYGEGVADDAHSAAEAAAHTVIHITQPGTYSLSGAISRGQIAVDLGEDAEDDPEAVVTLILDGLDITCEVAPAIIFNNVYECGDSDAETAARNVDTTAAGANVIIADGAENNVSGAYVARIYDPDSVELNEDGTEVAEAKKLHKYDAAFYSKMSMNVSGGEENTGVLNINAVNEGLDSELHLTINGGNINNVSGNDGINTNEDNVSVTTINGGVVTISVTGATGEGDGIDSNGWLVINGGTVIAEACAFSGDAGIDSDMGIHIIGGTVIATGHMLDRIEDGGQTYAVFNFTQKLSGDSEIRLLDSTGNALMTRNIQNDYSILIYSSPELVPGTYALYSGETQLAAQSGGMYGGAGRHGMMREDFDPSEVPEGFEFPGNGERPEKPEGDGETPDGSTERPGKNGDFGMQAPGGMTAQGEASAEIAITEGGNMFTGVAPLE